MGGGKRDIEKKNRTTRELRAWYKEHGICPACGRNEAAPGRVMCTECIIANRKRKAASSAHDCAVRKALREKRAEQGLCVWCGAKAIEGMKHCAKCRASINTSNRIRQIKKNMEAEVNVALQKSERVHKP